MIRYLLCFILTCNIVFAYTYESKMLQIHAKIAPRIILMSKKTVTDKSKKINITIVYEKGDEDSVDLLKSYMLKNYPKGLNSKSLHIDKVTYSNFKNIPKHSLVFLFDTNKDNIKKVVDYCINNKIITISYNDEYLKNGVLVSLHVGKYLKPYINIYSAKQSDIIFKNNLIAVSKIFYKDKN